MIQRKAPWVDVVVGTHALPHLLDLLTRIGDRRPPDGRARVHGDVPDRAAGGARRRVPCVGLDRSGVRQRLHVLHRAARAWAHSARARSATSSPRCQGLAARGVVEVTLLGQNVNTYGRDVTVPGSSPDPAVRRAASARSGRSTASVAVRFTSPHPHDFTPDVIEAMAETPDGLRAHPLPAAVGLRPRAEGDAAVVPARALPRVARADPRGDPRHRGVDRHHRRIPRRDRGGLRADARGRRAGRASTARSCSSTRRGPARGRPRSTSRCRRRSCRSGSTGSWRSRSGSSRRGRPPSSGPRSRCSWRAATGRASRPRLGRARTGSCTCGTRWSPGRSRRRGSSRPLRTT